MSTIEVRRATLDDVDFLISCALKIASETEGKTLDVNFVRPGITHCIEDSSLGAYYVACRGEERLGTTMITYEMSVAEGGQIHWIQSVYVVAEARNQGVFRAIFDNIVAEAKKDPLVKGVRLYVDHDNDTAMAVYSKLGMS